MPLDNNRPARIYQGLATGPVAEHIYETQDGIPVDGSKAILRDPTYGSPFTFRVLPPELLLSSLANADQNQSINLLSSALKINNTFSDYERRNTQFRQSQFFTQTNEDLVALETYVANNGVQFNARTGSSSLANDLAFSDLRQAGSVIAQLNRMVRTPPLTLLVNPQSLTVTRTKKQSYSERSRFGFIFDAWGMEQTRLNVVGKTGAFYTGTRFTDSDVPQNFRGSGGAARGRVSQTTAVSGVQSVSRQDSAAWQNLQALLAFYRNNGYIYDLLGGSEAHLWIGSIAIDYDQWTWIGHFESFSYGLTEQTNLGGVEFNFDFVADIEIDNAQREFQVLPISSPTPSPSDSLWSGQRSPSRSSVPQVGAATLNTNPPSVGGVPSPQSAAIIRRGRR